MRRTVFAIFVLLVSILLSIFAGCEKGSGGGPSSEATEFGLIPIEESAYSSIPVALVPPGGSLPESVDLSSSMPPPGEQGRQSSCVGWAVAYALRTYIEKRQQNWDTYSPENQFSPAFIYNQAARGNCGGGMRFVDALNILTSQGAATMASMPYTEFDCTTQPDESTRQQAQYFRVAQYRRLNVQDLFEVKAHLAAGFPVLISVIVDDYFENLGRGAVWTAKGSTTGFHAVVLVGYDDASATFKIFNSWGNDWGTDGYGWVSYDLFPRAVREGYIVAPFEAPPEPQPQPEPEPQPAPDYDNPPPEPDTGGFEQGIEIRDVVHNMQDENGLVGMNVRLKYTLVGYAGNSGQILLHFWFADGSPVKAVAPPFRDIYGNAAVGTDLFNIDEDSYVDYEFTSFVPYAALNVPAGSQQWQDGQLVYRQAETKLQVGAGLYINKFGVALADPVPFILKR